MIHRFHKLVEIAHALKPDSHEKLRTFHVSFVLNKKRIIAIGTNSPKTNPNNLLNPKMNREGKDISDEKFTCSEYSAFVKLKKTNAEARKCTLVNIRIDRNGSLNNSCPCQSCRGLLKWLNFKNVYYTNEHGKFVCA